MDKERLKEYVKNKIDNYDEELAFLLAKRDEERAEREYLKMLGYAVIIIPK